MARAGDEEKARAVLRVDGGPDVDARRLDGLTRDLAADLRSLSRVRVDAADATPPPDSKSGTAASLGTLVLSGVFSATTARYLATTIVAWFRRSEAREVSVEVGDRHVTLRGLSGKDQHAVVEALVEAFAAPRVAAVSEAAASDAVVSEESREV
jgi:hypothetical protein